MLLAPKPEFSWYLTDKTVGVETVDHPRATNISLPRSVKIEDNVAVGLTAADQRIAVRRWLDRVGPVAGGAEDEPGLATVAHPVRHDHCTGRSHPSASLRRLCNARSHGE